MQLCLVKDKEPTIAIHKHKAMDMDLQKSLGTTYQAIQTLTSLLTVGLYSQSLADFIVPYLVLCHITVLVPVWLLGYLVYFLCGNSLFSTFLARVFGKNKDIIEAFFMYMQAHM